MPRLYISPSVSDNINCVVEMMSGTPNVVFGSLSGYIFPTKLSACVIGQSSCTPGTGVPTYIQSSACTLKLEYSFFRDILSTDKIKISVFSYYTPLNYQPVNGF
jgi:hypothetical protein